MNSKLSCIRLLNTVVEHNYIPRFSLTDHQRVQLLKYHYKLKTGRNLNMREPKRFSEKIIWYMNYFDNPALADILCKVKFKNYVKEKLGDGYTAKLYSVWDDIDDINFDNLPNSFVLKSNCSSFGNNIIFIDNKKNVDIEQIKKEILPFLDYKNTAVNAFPRGYYKVTPKIFAEEIIGDAQNQPVDYKIFCFDGIPTYSYSAFEHFSDGKAQSSKIAFYDMEWNQLPVKYKQSETVSVPMPKHFEEMKKISSVLSKGFPFVRIDFYETDDRIYVGEMTFYSGGFSNSFTPDAFDFELGSKFVLPPKQKFKRIKRKDLIGK